MAASECERPRNWRAHWIWHPEIPLSSPAYVLFRNEFTLAEPVGNIGLRVSADERYVLYLDGEPISRGPSRSDRFRWRYRTIDTGALSAGRHVLAAVVRHLGSQAEVGQIGMAGGFLVAADAPFDSIFDTGVKPQRWVCKQDTCRLPGPQFYGGAFFRAVVTETIDGERATWDFAAPQCDPAGWVEPRITRPGEPLGAMDPGGPWWLAPDPLPEMEYRRESFEKIARIEGGNAVAWQSLVADSKALVVPARQRVTVVLDRGQLTNAYPMLVVSGGKGCRIDATWSEAAVDEQGHKGNRNEIAGKKIVGHQDRFLPDGGERRAFETYWFRPFRFCEMTIETADEPLTVERFDLHFAGYPFEQVATFETQGVDLGLPAIRRLGWHTLRLCARDILRLPTLRAASVRG